MKTELLQNKVFTINQEKLSQLLEIRGVFILAMQKWVTGQGNLFCV